MCVMLDALSLRIDIVAVCGKRIARRSWTPSVTLRIIQPSSVRAVTDGACSDLGHRSQLTHSAIKCKRKAKHRDQVVEGVLRGIVRDILFVVCKLRANFPAVTWVQHEISFRAVSCSVLRKLVVTSIYMYIYIHVCVCVCVCVCV